MGSNVEEVRCSCCIYLYIYVGGESVTWEFELRVCLFGRVISCLYV